MAVHELDELRNADEVDSAKFQEAVNDLTNITEPDRAPNDKPPIEDIQNIIGDVTDVFVKKSTVTESESKSVINLISNAVDETTKESWKTLINENGDGANTVMRDVERIVVKMLSQECSSEIDTKNLDVTVGSSGGNIRYMPASGSGEIFITKEALNSTVLSARNKDLQKVQIQIRLTGDVCYGGVHYETLSPILAPRLNTNGKIQEFGVEKVVNTDVLSLQLRQENTSFQLPVLLSFLVQQPCLKQDIYDFDRKYDFSRQGHNNVGVVKRLCFIIILKQELGSTNICIDFSGREHGLYDPVCVSWDFNAGNGVGAWSSGGCTFLNISDSGQLICLCSHLTNFAVLMSTSKTSKAHVKALSIISAVGCAVSICSLILTIVFHMLVWRYVRSGRSTILINICLALLIALTVFLAGINRTESTEACKAIAVLLHYLFLTVFFLMLIQGIEILISVVHVFAPNFRRKLLVPFAWGMPAVVVAISFGVTSTKGYGNKEYCWLSVDSGLIWAFVGPAALVIFMNIIVVLVVFKKLVSCRAMQNKSAKEKAKTSLRGICVLIPLLGSTWAFGILSINTDMVAFQYVFCILNSLQGLFIFIFHCVFNHQLRDAIKRKSAKKRSLAILQSDLRKRSASSHTGQDFSSVSQDNNNDETSDTTSKKKTKLLRHNVKQNKYAEKLVEQRK